MSLTLFLHPLASYCHKVLIALYEAGTPFEPRLIDLGQAADRAELAAHWPLAKFPVLHDAERQTSLPESSLIIEYLDHHFPGAQPMIPADWSRALAVRLWDRIVDNYVHAPMQDIVAHRLQGSSADIGGRRALLREAYALLDRQLATQAWLADAQFSLADCAAAPALFYATTLEPLPDALGRLQAYVERLLNRPSVTRTLAEARPYFHFYPFADAIPSRWR